MKLVKKAKIEKIMDLFLGGKVKLEEMKYYELTEKCLIQNRIERPTTGEFLWNLEFMLQVQVTDDKAAIVDAYTKPSIAGSSVILL
ncbi:hypothetical protein Bca4012_009903 [Brassica carinata]